MKTEPMDKLTEARVEAIAKARYDRCFDAFGDTTWEGLDQDKRDGWIVGARKDIASDPATALLAEAAEVLKEVCAVGELPAFDRAHALLLKIGSAG